jgi:hypothetical protein
MWDGVYSTMYGLELNNAHSCFVAVQYPEARIARDQEKSHTISATAAKAVRQRRSSATGEHPRTDSLRRDLDLAETRAVQSFESLNERGEAANEGRGRGSYKMIALWFTRHCTE